MCFEDDWFQERLLLFILTYRVKNSRLIDFIYYLPSTIAKFHPHILQPGLPKLHFVKYLAEFCDLLCNSLVEHSSQNSSFSGKVHPIHHSVQLSIFQFFRIFTMNYEFRILPTTYLPMYLAFDNHIINIQNIPSSILIFAFSSDIICVCMDYTLHLMRLKNVHTYLIKNTYYLNYNVWYEKI